VYRQVPNIITVSRLALTIVFFFLLHVHEKDTFTRQMWIGFVVFVVAALTDAIDGYLARKWKVESVFGRIVDPFVDKILIVGAFILFSSDEFVNVAALKYFPDARNITGVAPWMCVVLIAREFLITGIRGVAEAKGVDFSADWAGKVKMIVQSIAVGAIMVDLALTGQNSFVRITRDITIWTTVVVTALSAITYIVRARRLL